MKLAVAFIFLSLLIKDTSYLGDRYVLRGVSQGLSLLIGLYWLFGHATIVAWKKYVLLILLFLTIGASSFVASDPLYTGLQVASIGACWLVFLAYHERVCHPGFERSWEFLPKGLLLTAGLILAVSLVLIKVKPDLAYFYMETEGVWRYRGLFGQPASLAGLAAVIFGVALFSEIKIVFKIPILILSCLCLLLTTSRTYILAWLIALAFTILWRSRHKVLLPLATGAVICLAILFAAAFQISMNQETSQKVLRIDSLGNLTGRLTIWKHAFEYIHARPLLGYGFTTGDDAFKGTSNSLTSTALDTSSRTGIETKRYTLHNGYVQALLDTGFIGASLYAALLGYSIVNLVRSRDRRFAPALFVVVLSATANMGQSVMFSASTMNSLFAWYCTILGLCVGKGVTRAIEEPQTEECSSPDLIPRIIQRKPYDILLTK